MDTARTATIYQRLKTQDNFICASVTYPKVPRKGHKNLHRQHHRIKIRDKIGDTSSPILQKLAVAIQELCNQYHISVEYQHIPGIQNIQADRLSRFINKNNEQHNLYTKQD